MQTGIGRAKNSAFLLRSGSAAQSADKDRVRVVRIDNDASNASRLIQTHMLPGLACDSDVMGDGVYRSLDAGKTWKHMGLDQTGRIGRIVIDPNNADTVFVCALGRTTGPQQERGVFRTTDAGLHWDRVLFADENTGCSGLAMDPHNSHVLFAGMWQVTM